MKRILRTAQECSCAVLICSKGVFADKNVLEVFSAVAEENMCFAWLPKEQNKLKVEKFMHMVPEPLKALLKNEEKVLRGKRHFYEEEYEFGKLVHCLREERV